MVDVAVESYQFGRVSGSFYFAGYHAAFNFVLVGAAWETGLYVGSLTQNRWPKRPLQ